MESFMNSVQKKLPCVVWCRTLDRAGYITSMIRTAHKDMKEMTNVSPLPVSMSQHPCIFFILFPMSRRLPSLSWCRLPVYAQVKKKGGISVVSFKPCSLQPAAHLHHTLHSPTFTPLVSSPPSPPLPSQPPSHLLNPSSPWWSPHLPRDTLETEIMMGTTPTAHLSLSHTHTHTCAISSSLLLHVVTSRCHTPTYGLDSGFKLMFMSGQIGF